MISNKYLKYIGVFLFFFFIFLSLHFLIQGFWGSDPYYYSKHSSLILQERNITIIQPWIQYHFFANLPTNPWLGYEVILAGFIYCFGAIWGTKILISFLASLIFVSFYFIFCQWQINRPFVWTVFLFFISNAFLYRLFLERAFVGTITLLLLGVYCMFKKKYWLLFIISIFCTLYHQLAPLILSLPIFYCIASLFLRKKIDLKLLIAILGGLLVGLVLHPNSFNYIYIWFITFIKILYLKFTGVNLNVGAELQIQPFNNFLENNVIFLISYLIAIPIFIKNFIEKKTNIITTTLFLISIFWFILSLAIIRGIEFWIPFSWLFVVLIFSKFSQSKDFILVKQFISQKVHIKLTKFFIVSIALIFIGYNIFDLFNDIFIHNQNNTDIYFEEANEWLIENTQKDSIVFYPIWSMFPRMFFYNSHNYYIAGMDPTFLYEYNKEIYYTWANISYYGVYCPQAWPCLDLTPQQELEAVSIATRRILESETIIIPNKEENILYKVLYNLSDDFEQVFVNKELIIFKIKDL